MAEQSKGTPEVWSAGIGRKSNAQYGSDLMVEVLRELGIKYIALTLERAIAAFTTPWLTSSPARDPR